MALYKLTDEVTVFTKFKCWMMFSMAAQ